MWGSEDRDISRRQGFCTPRPERLPEGEAEGQSRGPRGAKILHEGNLKFEEVCVGFCGCGALLQSAMGTKFRSKCGPNGDPILSEMGA